MNASVGQEFVVLHDVSQVLSILFIILTTHRNDISIHSASLSSLYHFWLQRRVESDDSRGYTDKWLATSISHQWRGLAIPLIVRYCRSWRYACPVIYVSNPTSHQNTRGLKPGSVIVA